MHRQDLERMTREQLIAQAERLGLPRPRVLTAPELIDEIIGRTTKNDRERAKARGWLGRARDLLARVVERNLHLPEAARVLRKDGDDKGWPAPPPPLPTVTLAEIYAAQGHFERALAVLDEVIARDPDHREAHAMRARFAEQHHKNRSRTGKEVPPGQEETMVMTRSEAPPVTVPPVTVPSGQGAPTPAEVAPQVVVVSAAPPEAPTTPPVERLASTSAHETDVEEAPVTHVSAALETGRVVLAVRATPAESSPDTEVDLAAADTEAAPAVVAPIVEEAPALAASAAEALPEEPPLPDRYEVDEIVAIAVDPRTLYFYWEVRPTTLAHAQAAHPDGWLCVRVASFMASWEGPLADARDLQVDGLHGDRFLRDIQPGSNLRVSVGWNSGAGFEPFAVGSEVTAPRAIPVETVAQEVARWEAEPVVAPFQNPHQADAPAAGAGLVMRQAPSFLTPSAAVERSFAHAHARSTGPVDTGVAWWEEPLEAVSAIEGSPSRVVEVEGDPLLEDLPGWSEAPGGSSELGRGGPAWRLRPVHRRRLIPGAPGRAGLLAWPLGGASESYPGGASELPR